MSVWELVANASVYRNINSFRLENLALYGLWGRTVGAGHDYTDGANLTVCVRTSNMRHGQTCSCITTNGDSRCALHLQSDLYEDSQNSESNVLVEHEQSKVPVERLGNRCWHSKKCNRNDLLVEPVTSLNLSVLKFEHHIDCTCPNMGSIYLGAGPCWKLCRAYRVSWIEVKQSKHPATGFTSPPR